jgi:RHS repeat-associated protein
MPNRTFSLSSKGYRFGFNGKELENDLYGSGNAYDFGARVHDARSGRFLSLDPLSIKYPMHSNYSFSANNPIYFIEVKGMYFTGNIKVLNKHIAMLKTSSSKEAKQQLANIQRMQQSDIEFHIQNQEYSPDIFSTNERNAAGSAMFDFEYNRMNIKFDELHSRLAHELEHGRQFMDGEIDFEQTSDGKSVNGPMYDKIDEFNAYKAQQEFETDKDKMSDSKIKRHINSDNNYRKLDEDPQTLNEKYESDYHEKNIKNQGGDYKSKFNYTPTEEQKSQKANSSENVKF